MSVNTFWKKVKSSPVVLYPNIRIPDENILDANWEPQLFQSEENYFELRITEQFLKDRREYWNEYNPLTVILSEFIYGNQKNAFPFVVGPDILKGLEQLKGDENVRYKNTRVAGPAPYRGDQLALFVGLFRIKTKDWAREALGLLEKVAKAFDSSKLTSYLSIADPLMDGIESFLGMGDQMQFRLGCRNEYEDPETSSDNQLKSGFHVMLRTDMRDIREEMFWVKDNQLFTGTSKSNLKLYMENDYILHEIAHMTVRNDYTTFDFHVKWKELQNLIWKTDDKNQTVEAYQQLIAMLRTNSDLIESHIKKLQLFYRAKFQQEWQSKEAASNPLLSPDTMGPDFFAESNKRFNKLKVDDKTKKAIDLSNDYLHRLNKDAGAQKGPLKIQESDISRVLTSGLLDEKTLKLADLDNISSALGSEMPLV